MRYDIIRRRTVLLGAVLWAALACQGWAAVLYVDDDAPPGGNGSSWQNAFKYLQDALTAAATAEKPVDICVARGIYKPDRNAANPEGTRDRRATFQTLSGATLKGGYAGLGAPDPNLRDIAKYETILSGDLAGDDVLTEDPCDFVPAPNEGRWDRPTQWCLLIESTRRENSLHVVTSSSAGEPVVLDGVTVTGGNAYLPPYLWAGRDPMLIIKDEDCGGGLFHQEGPLALSACRFVSNSAFAGSGGVYVRASEHVTMTGCLFLDNFGFRGIGGASLIQIPEVTMSGCTFEKNSSWYDLSALHLAECTLHATDCEFEDNTSMYAREPAVLIAGTTTSISRSAFTRNEQGALVVRYSDLTIEDSKFQGNAAAYGAAMNIQGGKVGLLRCTFAENVASWDGGAINSNASAINVSGCEFRGNVSDARGGAISNFLGSMTITSGIFSGNCSRDMGGALFSAKSSPSMVNCTFCGNTASKKGGALYGFYATTYTIANCILWHNESPQGPHVCLERYPDTSPPSNVNLSYSSVGDGKAGVSLDSDCVLVWGEGNIEGDPCFANPGYWDSNGTLDSLSDDYWVAGDYHLKSQAGRWDPVGSNWVKDELTSPCIDAGDPNSPVGDEPEPNGGRINMGAYGGTTEASKSYLGDKVGP